MKMFGFGQGVSNKYTLHNVKWHDIFDNATDI